jgi:Methyltransferase domain
MSVYNSDFYRTMIDGAEVSARTVLSKLFLQFQPSSILDLGCGVGCWLRVARELGVANVHGFDGDYVNRKQLRIPETDFCATDLFTTMPPLVHTDLAICLEVAEHLPESRADAVVEYLTECAHVVLFSAAIPRQGGTQHLNEQWQSYWAAKFDERGFLVSTALRDELWRDSTVKVWYRQNGLVFARPGRCGRIEDSLVSYTKCVLDVVHPDLFEMKLSRYSMLEAGWTGLQRAVNAARSALYA